jgi:hypothetical protein
VLAHHARAEALLLEKRVGHDDVQPGSLHEAMTGSEEVRPVKAESTWVLPLFAWSGD